MRRDRLMVAGHSEGARYALMLATGVTPNSWQAWLIILLPGLLVLAAGLTFALVVALRS